MFKYAESYKKFKKRIKDKKKLKQVKATAESSWKINQEYRRFVKEM